MDTHEFITAKINQLKEKHPSLRSRTDDYVFSVLCFKNHFYKNPALVLNEDDFAEIVVDGSRDGGADILLTDPNSETSDLIIGQSKFYKTISKDTVLNAMRKMADFYNDMAAGHYEQFNSRVQSRFLTLNAERGEESTVHFVFYTSAPKKKSTHPTLKPNSASSSRRLIRLKFRYFLPTTLPKKFAKPKPDDRVSNAAKSRLTRQKIICSTATTRRLSTFRLFQSSNFTPSTEQICCRSTCAITSPAAKSTKKFASPSEIIPRRFG